MYAPRGRCHSEWANGFIVICPVTGISVAPGLNSLSLDLALPGYPAQLPWIPKPVGLVMGTAIGFASTKTHTPSILVIRLDCDILSSGQLRHGSGGSKLYRLTTQGPVKMDHRFSDRMNLA